MSVAAVPVPVATARIGWTVYERGTGRILGWVRRTDDGQDYRAIPCVGPGIPELFVNVRHAAHALEVR